MLDVCATYFKRASVLGDGASKTQPHRTHLQSYWNPSKNHVGLHCTPVA